MTRKDFVAIAKAFAQTRPIALSEAGELQIAQWRDDIAQMCRVFERDNPRFDRERFYKACEGDKA